MPSVCEFVQVQYLLYCNCTVDPTLHPTTSTSLVNHRRQEAGFRKLSHLGLLACRSDASSRIPTTSSAAAAAVAVRSMSLEITNVAHRPPLDLATYIAASKTLTLDKVEGEASSLQSVEFASFLENPLFSRDDSHHSLGARRVTLNLMTTLAGNARLSSIGDITDDYIKPMKAKRGEVEATIISAKPLTKDMRRSGRQ